MCTCHGIAPDFHCLKFLTVSRSMKHWGENINGTYLKTFFREIFLARSGRDTLGNKWNGKYRILLIIRR